MKSFLISAGILCSFLILSERSFSQATSINQGVLMYSIKLQIPEEAITDEMKDLNPKVRISFKGDKSLMQFEGVPQMEGNMIVMDAGKHEAQIAMNKDGKKYKVVITEEMMKKQQEESKAEFDSMQGLMNMFTAPDSTDATPPEATQDFSIKVTDERETILQYDCRKYTAEWMFLKFEFYNTEMLELPAAMLNYGNFMSGSTSAFDFSKMKGFPLKINMQLNVFGQLLKVQFLATSLEAQPVSEKIFQIPKDYKEISYEEFKELGMH